MKEILIDLLVIWLSVILGAFALNHHIPVLIFVAVVFLVTGVCWMVMDFWYQITDNHHDKT